MASIVYGSATIEANFFVPAKCGIDTTKRQIALTFDDGPVTSITPKVLDVLKAYNVQACFFCIGSRIVGNEQLLQRIAAEGHLIGNHSFSHAYGFDFYPAAKVIADLQKTEQLIQQVIGKKTKLFRPPYGVTNPPIQKAVEKLGYEVIGWRVRSLDTAIKNEQQVVKRVVDRMLPGDVILLHDSHERIVPILKNILDYAKQNGYECIRLDKLLNIKAYE